MPVDGTAGYSGTPLARKLGIAAGSCVVLRHAPGDYAALVDPVPAGAVFAARVSPATVGELALPLGFVDVKVCAVSAVWSGLKLVVRKALRELPTQTHEGFRRNQKHF